MNKKGEQTNVLVGIILLFMILMIGFSFLTPIASTKESISSKAVISNQSVVVDSAYIGANEINEDINLTIYDQSAWKQSECPLTALELRNTAGTVLVADTDYTLYTAQGVYSFLNTSDTVPRIALNKTYVDYSYCRDGYLTSSGDRTLLALVQTMLILVLIVAGVAFVYKQFQ